MPFVKSTKVDDILYRYRSIYCTIKRREAGIMEVKNTYPATYKNKEERAEAVKKAYKKVYITLILQNDVKKEIETL